RLLRDWGEGVAIGGGVGAVPALGDATWKYSFFNTTLWSIAGASSDGADRSSVPSASQTVGTVLQNYTWGPAGAVVSDVKLWLDQPAANFGWLILGDETVSQTARRFDSRESDASVRPSLAITFIAPPIISPIPNASGSCGTAFTSAAPALTQGSL